MSHRHFRAVSVCLVQVDGGLRRDGGVAGRTSRISRRSNTCLGDVAYTVNIPIRSYLNSALFRALDIICVTAQLFSSALEKTKMYFVESTHHSHTDNSGLLPTDERYKPTSKQKNAVSLLSDRRRPTPDYAHVLDSKGECGKRPLGYDTEIWILVDVLLHWHSCSRNPEQSLHALLGIKTVRGLPSHILSPR